MALHTKKLYYRRGGTTYSIDLYTTTAEVGSEYIALNDAGTVVYAAIIAEGSNGESYLRIRKSGITKSILSTMTVQELSALINYDISKSSSYPGSGTSLTDIGISPTMNATLYNGVSYSSADGGSLVFDGANDYVASPYNAAMSPTTGLSIAVWVKINSFNTSGIVSRIESTGAAPNPQPGYGITLEGERAVFHPMGVYPINNVTSNVRMQLGVWRHIVCTYDKNIKCLYVDGVLDNSGASSAEFANSLMDLVLCRYYSNFATSYYAAANIGQVKLFVNQVLSASDVLNEFIATRARFGLSPICITEYDVSDVSSYPGSGTVIYDISASPVTNNGTLTNGVGYSTGNGGVLTFDGVNDYALINGQPAKGLTSGTIIMWVKPSSWNWSSGAGKYLWGANNALPGSGGCYSYIGAHSASPGAGKFEIGVYTTLTNWAYATSSTLPLPGTWYHVAASWGPSGTKILVNSANKGQNPTARNNYTSSAVNETFGATGNVGSYFHGSMGENRIFNYMLSDAEILEDFNTTKARYGFVLPVTGDVIYYSIDETSSYPGSGTTVYDISGSANTHDGTLVNGVGYSSAYGGVLTFDGTNDYISITNHTDFDLGLSNEPFAIEGWIYFLSVSGQKQCLFTKGGGADLWTSTGQQYIMFPNNGPLYWQFKSGAADAVVTSMISNSSLSINTWYHVVISYDGTTTKMYLNTVQQNSTSTASYYKPSSGAAIVRIGAVASGNAAYYAHEYLGMAKIYKGTYLTSEQVTESYNATKDRFGINPASPIGTVVYDIANLTSYIPNTSYLYDVGEQGTSHTGTLMNGVAYAPTNAGVLVFDGSDDYVSLTDHTDFDLGLGGEPFSMGGWLRFGDVTTSNIALISKAGGVFGWMSSGYQYFFMAYSGTFRWSWKKAATVTEADNWAAIQSGSIAINTWYYVMVTYDGTGTKMYVNGIENWSASYGASTSPYVKPAVSNIVRVGAVAPSAYGNHTMGMMKLLKGTAMSAAEIAQEFNNTKARYGL